MLNEYLPFLSAAMLADGMIGQPLRAVIRKGKSHYVCDRRQERRLGQLDLRKKNWRAGNALLSLRETLDLDEAPRLSGYDRQRVCVPKVCDCGEEDCRYLRFLDACDRGDCLFQICSHNLLSCAAMSAVKERLSEKDLLWPLFTLGRNAAHTTEQFKASPGSVLLATGAAWEGFDFPGDCVSLLIIPRLPFARPDALKEKEREAFPNLHSFIQAIVVPDMQIKLKQGFGRAIRTETDTCVIAILDERSTPGQRYFEDVKTALPDMRITDSLEDVREFIWNVKGSRYFEEPFS